jgi:hypothetical protein
MPGSEHKSIKPVSPRSCLGHHDLNFIGESGDVVLPSSVESSRTHLPEQGSGSRILTADHHQSYIPKISEPPQVASNGRFEFLRDKFVYAS